MTNISAETVVPEWQRLREDDVERGRASLRAIPTEDVVAPVIRGHVVASLGFTRSALSDLTPAEWHDIASTLLALVRREPVKSSPRYAPERILLGALALELDSYARCAGEEVEGELPATGIGLRGGVG